jgi:hypothetical protein
MDVKVTCFYERLLHNGVLVLALLATILMVLSVDILDTISNNFIGGEKAAKNYRDWLYRRVGPFFPKGGVSYAYLGYACFSIFLIFSLALLHPCLASIGVGIYFYLGFPFLFGYSAKFNDQSKKPELIEPHEGSSYVAGVFGFLFVFVAILIEFISDEIANSFLDLILIGK